MRLLNNRAPAPLSTPAIRRVLLWQAGATVAGAVAAYAWGGGHAALSAVLGGMVNIAAVVVFAVNSVPTASPSASYTWPRIS